MIYYSYWKNPDRDPYVRTADQSTGNAQQPGGFQGQPPSAFQGQQPGALQMQQPGGFQPGGYQPQQPAGYQNQGPYPSALPPVQPNGPNYTIHPSPDFATNGEGMNQQPGNNGQAKDV